MKIARRFFLVASGMVMAAFLLTGRLCPADQADDDYLKQWTAKCDQLLAEWKTHPAKPDDELSKQLIEAAVRAERPEVVEMVVAGTTDVAGMEIKTPAKIRVIEARTVRNLGKLPAAPYEDNVIDCVFHRMTKDRFEAWTPERGWLFDGDGKLLNTASPPRHGGIGREWHGAFLPDGSWVTTDLWEYDRTLTFFSRKGKWLKEIPSEALAPPKQYEGNGHDLIGWARCDQTGKGWVVSIGSEEGRARVFVTPQGKPQPLEDQNVPWKLCYPRDLEPKGDYTHLSRPSDDFKEQMEFTGAPHGMWVGFPTYYWGGGKVTRIIPGGYNNFGFLPATYDVYISAEIESGDEYPAPPPALETWFFSASGTFRGWALGNYFADDPDGKGIWLLDGDHCVVALGADLKPLSRMRFLIDGKKAVPMKLFTDLRLGFFSLGARVVLARW